MGKKMKKMFIVIVLIVITGNLFSNDMLIYMELQELNRKLDKLFGVNKINTNYLQKNAKELKKEKWILQQKQYTKNKVSDIVHEFIKELNAKDLVYKSLKRYQDDKGFFSKQNCKIMKATPFNLQRGNMSPEYYNDWVASFCEKYIIGCCYYIAIRDLTEYLHGIGMNNYYKTGGTYNFSGYDNDKFINELDNLHRNLKSLFNYNKSNRKEYIKTFTRISNKQKSYYQDPFYNMWPFNLFNH